MIASSTSITLKGGIISADGGSAVNTGCGYCSGDGSGGGIRLIAPAIASDPYAYIHASAPNVGCVAANGGRTRIEAFNLTNFNQNNVSGPVSYSQPLQVSLPATPPATLKVTSIAGVPINANPFSFPDGTINSSAPVPVVIQAQYVPPGTVPTVYVFSETGPDQTISAPALSGTLQSSTSTVNVTFPTGGSRGFVKATL